MARHDREESLEEQLAWLDAIKETEETPISVSASGASEETVVSPYPQDPWLSVPTQHETPTPLFRAAVGSVYGTAPTDEAAPERRSEPPSWLDSTDTQDDVAPAEAPAKEQSPGGGSPGGGSSKTDDAFLAPLKPLPRPDDTDSYSLLSLPELKLKPQSKPEPEAEKPQEKKADAWPAPEKKPEPWPAPQEKKSDAWPTPPEWPPPAEPPAADEPRAAEKPRLTEKPRPAEEPAPGASEPPPPVEDEATLPRLDVPLTFDVPRPAEQPSAFDEPRTFDEPRSFDEPKSPFEESKRALDEPKPSRTFDEPPRAFGEPRPFEPERSFEQPRAFNEPRTFDEPRSFDEPKSPFDEPRTFDEPRRAFDEPRPFDHPQPFDDSPPPPRRPAPVPVFSAPPRPPVTGRPTADSLDPESLLRGRRNAPSKGWRRLVYKASGGWIKPGEPPEVRRRRELVTRARTPVASGHHRVAVLSLKGGVGKTTTTVGLGATLAQMRGDRVIAVDANPDRGTLSDKLTLETSATVRDLLNESDQVKRYVDIRAFTSQAPSRLEVLASDRDPSVSEAFSGADYQSVSQVLENFYSICITDCGTGLLHSAMGGVLGLADQIVLVSSPSVDGARAASATLDWLEAHHYGNLVREATVVLCSVRPRSKSAVDISKLEAHFAARCRAVIRVPYDPHLEEGAEIDLDRLQETTRDAYLQLAACVGDGFAARGE
ncbi:nucleotide-binding protein [Nonomuraea rhizosphaerae]|uniref:nucleotide-binding protein n=1 Tax=Nonomuraea rhizosphaerae TaxID=2665663 RepID=UPI0027E38129|nr:AAA family ATPase [Nonomuraea rhizosphaerae]